MRHALALNCRLLEKDASPAADLVVECSGCDPDNPRGVPRKSCKRCGGTGFSSPALTAIVEEIHESRLQLLRGGRDQHDE